MSATLPRRIVIPETRDMLGMSIKTLTSGKIMVTHEWWLPGGKGKGSVTLYYDPGCISWQIIDPIRDMVAERMKQAQMDLARLQDRP